MNGSTVAPTGTTDRLSIWRSATVGRVPGLCLLKAFAALRVIAPGPGLADSEGDIP